MVERRAEEEEEVAEKRIRRKRRKRWTCRGRRKRTCRGQSEPRNECLGKTRSKGGDRGSSGLNEDDDVVVVDIRGK